MAIIFTFQSVKEARSDSQTGGHRRDVHGATVAALTPAASETISSTRSRLRVETASRSFLGSGPEPIADFA